MLAANPPMRSQWTFLGAPRAFVMSQAVAGIILAAGKGTRMKSDLPKVLHRVSGVPMVGLAARAMREAGVERIVVVIGHGAELVREELGEGFLYAIQDPPQGTGDAARKGYEALGEWDGPVLVASGDTPLTTGEALKQLIDRQRESGAASVVATVVLDDPTGYGRILMDGSRYVGIVEEKDATPEQRQLKETCVSVYCFDGKALRSALPKLDNSNAQGEYYLTDVPALTSADGGEVALVRFDDHTLFSGVNDRIQLAEAESVLRNRILRRHMAAGVTIIDPQSTYIGLDVEIGPDTVLHPNTVLEGNTKIGLGCEIGPNTRIRDCHVGDGALIEMSNAKDSTISEGCRIGPFANLRSQAVLGAGVKIGNFVEVKNSRLAERVSAAHLSYLGDSDVGARTNIGAGTITCNYDGFTKHRTSIGEAVFIGSNSTLIAPLRIGDRAMVAAGSVINREVPEDAAAFGRARQDTKESWAAQWRIAKSESK